VKSDCCFNQLSFYHCVDGIAPDIMHDLFEGIIPYEFTALVRSLKKKKILNLDEINRCILSFKFGKIDKQSKPSKFFDSQEGNFKQTASRMFTFFRLFGIMFGKKLKLVDEFKSFCELYEIVQIILLDKINQSIINYLSVLIVDHLKQFQIVYGLNISPKQHFLLHYPNLIEKFGPLKHFWTFRFESKHRYFKQLIKASHNFINITHTLLKRHQSLFYLNMFNNTHERMDFHSMGHISFSELRTQFNNNSINSIFQKCDNIQKLKWIKLNGMKYYEKNVLFLQVDTNTKMPIFGIVEAIYLSDDNSIVFAVQQFETISYCTYRQCYIVRNSKNQNLINLNNLTHKYPLDLYNCEDNLNENLIALKYNVFELVNL
jgi:hypothetical protein